MPRWGRGRGRPPRTRVPAAVLLGLVLLAGCTTGGGQRDAQPAGSAATAGADPYAVSDGPRGRPSRALLGALRTACARTRAAASARTDATLVLGERVTTRSTGVLGWSGSLSGTLRIRYTGGTMAATMRELGSTATEARFVSDTYYARMSDTFARLTGGRHWIRYDLDPAVNLRPDQSLAVLLISHDVRRVGTERVRGVRAVHYRGTVRPEDPAGAGLGKDAGNTLRQRLEEAGITVQRTDAWVDARGRLVKRVERSETAQEVLSTTAYYEGFGARVVTRPAPPPSDTADFQDLVGGGQ